MENAIFAYCRGRLPEGFMPRVVEILERANMDEARTIIINPTLGEAFEVYRVMMLSSDADQKLMDKVKLATIEVVCLE